MHIFQIKLSVEKLVDFTANFWFDLPGRWTLLSASNNHLMAPRVKLSTVGSQAFGVANPCVWNELPIDVISAYSLLIFRDC